MARTSQTRQAQSKNHGPSIKDDEQYEALRREGASKEKAARITNAGSRQDRKQGRQPPVRGPQQGGTV